MVNFQRKPDKVPRRLQKRCPSGQASECNFPLLHYRRLFYKQEEAGKNTAASDIIKEQHQSGYRGESIGALDAAWGCQRDGLDGAGEHLSGCKAGKQIKRDELQLGGLLLASWSSITGHESVKAAWICNLKKNNSQNRKRTGST